MEYSIIAQQKQHWQKVTSHTIDMKESGKDQKANNEKPPITKKANEDTRSKG